MKRTVWQEIKEFVGGLALSAFVVFMLVGVIELIST